MRFTDQGHGLGGAFNVAFLNHSCSTQQIDTLQVPPLPLEALKHLPNSDNPITKSILKKPNSTRKKSDSHVNYAFEFDEIPATKGTKKKKPKSATVIDKRTGKSKQIVIENTEKKKNEHVINVEIH